MADLLSYAAYGRVPHAPIEPFHHLITHFRPAKRIGFSAVYFEDPRRFLHMDPRGKLALTSEDLAAEKIIACDPDRLDGIESCPEYREHMESWRSFFLTPTDCACCQGWLACLGGLSHAAGKSPETCGKVMAELMDAGDCFRAKKKRKRTLWRF